MIDAVNAMINDISKVKQNAKSIGRWENRRPFYFVFLFGRSLAVVGISTLHANATKEVPSALCAGAGLIVVLLLQLLLLQISHYEPSLYIAKSEPLLALRRQLLLHGLHQPDMRVGAFADARVVPGFVWSMLYAFESASTIIDLSEPPPFHRLTASAAPPAASRRACPRRRAAAYPARGPRTPPSTAVAALCM